MLFCCLNMCVTFNIFIDYDSILAVLTIIHIILFFPHGLVSKKAHFNNLIRKYDLLKKSTNR